MPHQVALTIRAFLAPGRADALSSLLADMHTQGPATNHAIPFGQLDGVHFARLFVLPDARDLDGADIPASLCYMADVDAPASRHLEQLLSQHPAGVDAVFGHCVDYPEDPGSDRRLAWLRAHTIDAAANYIHRPGRSVIQIEDEAKLHNEIAHFLDRPGSVPAAASARQAQAAIRRFVEGRSDLRWALRPPSPPRLWFRLRELGHKLVVPALAVLAFPVVLVGGAALLVAVRLKEHRDVPATDVPTSETIAASEQYEDYVAQNPFTAIGLVKPGPVRAVAMRVVLFAIDYGSRHVYDRDNLGGVHTLHFARFVPIDDGRRLIFASSYDGSLESYMDDFINLLAWGLNAVFSNGVGWPRTRWLIFGGARDEVAFKNYLRCHQLPTPVWFSAYDDHPAPSLDASSALREDLPRELDERRAAELLAGV